MSYFVFCLFQDIEKTKNAEKDALEVEKKMVEAKLAKVQQSSKVLSAGFATAVAKAHSLSSD